MEFCEFQLSFFNSLSAATFKGKLHSLPTLFHVLYKVKKKKKKGRKRKKVEKEKEEKEIGRTLELTGDV